MLHLALLSFAVLVMSMSACDAQELPKVPREQLLQDQTYAIETLTTLANAIAPDMPWTEKVYPELGCLASDGQIKGYQTSFRLRLRSEDVGHDIDDAKAIDAARTWFSEQRFQLVLDEHRADGLRQLRAVKEDDADGIGISINAHPGIVGLRGATKCRP